MEEASYHKSLCISVHSLAVVTAGIHHVDDFLVKRGMADTDYSKLTPAAGGRRGLPRTASTNMS